jgi:hypothetical protein
MARYPHRGWAFIVALDQAVGALITGWPDPTISAWAWVWERDGKRAWPRKLIDGLFFWDKYHCRESYRMELEARHLPPEFAVPLE